MTGMSVPKAVEIAGFTQLSEPLRGMRRFASRLTHPLYLLAGLLIVVFLFGGSARPDSLGQLVVVPVSLAMLLVGIWRYAGSLSNYRSVSLLLVAACAIILLQLIPLPPSVWMSLPGHGQLEDIARITGTDRQWRPVNLVPQLGWVSLGAMLTPAAVLALAGGVAASSPPPGKSAFVGGTRSKGMARLIMLVIVIGTASALMSVVQLLGDPTGPLYLHRITNAGAAVGFFANRNHNAAFLVCMLPLLAAWASTSTRNARHLTTRNAALLGIASLTIVLVLVGGSRAGILLAGIAIAWSLIIYRPVETRQIRGEQVGLTRLKRGFAAALLVGLILLTVILSRAKSVDRAIDTGASELTVRWDFWQVTWRQAWEFFPLGTGLGSFVESYRMAEPLDQLTTYYVNHAHNDWLEVFHGGGIAAVVVLAAVVLWWLTRTVALFRTGARERSAGRLALAGSAVMSILGVASFVDYPLRTAPLAALLMLAMLWLSGDPGGDE